MLLPIISTGVDSLVLTWVTCVLFSLAENPSTLPLRKIISECPVSDLLTICRNAEPQGVHYLDCLVRLAAEDPDAATDFVEQGGLQVS